MASTYMSLTIPSVGVSTGREGANNLVADLNIIDAHDHSPGYGTQITPSGLNINADLSIGSNNLTDANSLRMDNRSSNITAASPNLTCLYAVNDELWYNDGNGSQVQITSGGFVNAGSGSIGGMSGTVAVDYSSPTFTFSAGTNIAASVEVRDVIMHNAANTTYAYTITLPTLTANTGLTLPLAPASSVNALGRICTMSTGSAMVATLDIDNTTIGITGSNTLEVKDGSITSAKIANATIVAADISASAAITGSQLSASAGIVGTQLASGTLTTTQISSTALIPTSKFGAANSVAVVQLTAGAYTASTTLATRTLTSVVASRPIMLELYSPSGGWFKTSSPGDNFAVWIRYDGTTTIINYFDFTSWPIDRILPSTLNCSYTPGSTSSHTFTVGLTFGGAGFPTFTCDSAIWFKVYQP